PNDAPLAVGLSDGIRTALSRLRGVVVLGYATASLEHAATSKPPAEIASDLGASAVVTGTVRRVDDRVHVEVHLFDAAANKRLRTHGYDLASDDLIPLPIEATRAILAALDADATPAERATLDRP